MKTFFSMLIILLCVVFSTGAVANGTVIKKEVTYSIADNVIASKAISVSSFEFDYLYNLPAAPDIGCNLETVVEAEKPVADLWVDVGKASNYQNYSSTTKHYVTEYIIREAPLNVIKFKLARDGLNYFPKA